MKKLLLTLFACALILYTFPSFADWGNNIGAQPMKWTSISTATTTVVKTGATFLHTIVVTGGTAGTIAIYASGATVNAPVFTTFSSTNTPNTYLFDANLTSGCTVITGAATNMVINYL